jgi:8-amino-7-oxononanoate synthase
MSRALAVRLRGALDERRARDLFRTLDARSGAQGPRIRVAERELSNFSSNDYLSLANDPRLRAAACAAIDRYGVGSGASPLLSGRADVVAALEQRLAAFLRREACLTFVSGYAANLSTLTALVRRGDAVLADRLIHASLIDGLRLAGARLLRYPHLDPAAVRKGIRDRPPRFIVSEGLFSMDGDIAPMRDLIALAAEYGAALLIDDAHGIGVLGERRRGVLDLFGIGQAEVPLLVGTLGKAFGASGAFVAGSRDLIDALVQFARPYIYSTALPAVAAAAALAALEIIEAEDHAASKLQANVRHFRSCLNGPTSGAALTPIQPVLVGSSARALACAEALQERGFYVRAIRPPTVPHGTARLRISLCAGHSFEEIEALCAALREVGAV